MVVLRQSSSTNASKRPRETFLDTSSEVSSSACFLMAPRGGWDRDALRQALRIYLTSPPYTPGHEFGVGPAASQEVGDNILTRWQWNEKKSRGTGAFVGLVGREKMPSFFLGQGSRQGWREIRQYDEWPQRGCSYKSKSKNINVQCRPCKSKSLAYKQNIIKTSKIISHLRIYRFCNVNMLSK